VSVTPEAVARRRHGLDPLEEQYDAARWLNDGSGRVLLFSEPQLSPCCNFSPHEPLGQSASLSWFLVRSGSTLDCIRKGNVADAIRYSPGAP
jgi:hypothetical protein